MTRAQFLNLEFPNKPYSSFSRGPSTCYNESFHIENKNNEICFNFYWDDNQEITCTLYNNKEKNLRNKYKKILNSIKYISKEQIEDLLNLYWNI